MEYNIKEFWPSFMFYFNLLASYEFSFFNPLFWAALLLLLLILIQRWSIKKSLHFCIALAVILLGTTKLEGHFAMMQAEPNQYFDASVIKLISGFVVAILSLFYYFLV